MRLREAVVVVTGASSGIGEATALRFARAGSRLALAARRVDRLDALASRIEAHGGRAMPVRCDVTVAADRAGLAETVLGTFGRCDVLVNNAGVPGGGPFLSLTSEQIDHVLDVNLRGVVQTTKAFLPMMLDRGSGHVVNVASLAGRFALPGASMYSATKHAVIAFSESLYHELKDVGILVTAVNPFFARTESFPTAAVPPRLLIDVERIARTIEDVVRRDRAPEVSVPRSIAALQAFRVLTPPVYRRVVERIARRRAGR
jgi:short-subunit dehydrogenase